MACLLIGLTITTQARAESPTHTLLPTSYCLELDSAQKIAREDATNGLEAASTMFSEAPDCNMGQGQVVIISVISTHKVKRPSGDKTLYVYEAKNPFISFYILTTQKLVKEDSDA